MPPTDVLLDLVPFAVALLVALAVGYMFWSHFFGAAKRERERQGKLATERSQRARTLGWRYQDTADGRRPYRLHGTSPGGEPWTIEYDTDTPGRIPTPRLVFRVARTGRTDIAWRIADRGSYKLMHSLPGRAIIGVFLALITALSSMKVKLRQSPELTREIPAGSATFRQRFVMFGPDARAAKLVDAEVERMILGWPEFRSPLSRKDNSFSAALGPAGLEVKLACVNPDFAVIEHLARLGQRLVDRMGPR